MIHQHKMEAKSMRLELREKEESFEESIEQMEVQLQVSFICSEVATGHLALNRLDCPSS